MTSEEAYPQEPPSMGIDLREERLTGTVLRLAGPVLAERLSLTAIHIVDALLVGRFVGSDGVAGVGIGSLLFWVPMSGAWALNVGATAVVARDAGARALGDIQRSVRASLVFALIWGLVITVFMVPLAPSLMRLMAAEPDVLDLGVDYIRVASLGIVFLAVMYAATGCLRGVGNTRTPMLILIVANTVNAFVAFFLMSGVMGLPKLGVIGSAAGFASAGAVGAVLAVGVLIRGYEPIHFNPFQALMFGRREIGRVLNIAVPVGLEELQFEVAFLAYSRIITGLGTAATAAHTLSLRALDIAIAPGFALATAGTAIVGQSLGAGLPDLAERAGKEARKWALLTMIILGAGVAILAPWIVGAFVDDKEVVDIGSRCLRVFALGFPMMGAGTAISGALRGAGDVRYVLAVQTVTAWTVRIPAAFLFVHAVGWGAPGAWVGAVAEQNARGILVWLRFAGDRWKTKEV